MIMSSEARAVSRSPRLPGLDLIRATAIAWVMVYHAMNYSLISEGHWYVDFGWMGVDIFFVLSGYLIAGQLFKPFRMGLKPNYANFFSRRLLRTLPAYITMLAIYFLIPSIRETPDIQPFWQFATFTENLFIDLTTHKTFTHVWSLCVEEQFYLLFPLVVWGVAQNPSSRKVYVILLSILAFGMIIRGYLWIAHASAPLNIFETPEWRPFFKWIYYPTWSRLDGLLAGVSIAAIKAFRPMAWQRLSARGNAVLVMGLVGIGASMVFFGSQFASLLPTVLGFPLLSFSIALVVIAAASPSSIIGHYSVPGAKILATGAYSLYLSQKLAYHLVIAGYIPSFGARGMGQTAIAVVAAFIMATVLYWTVERPFLKLRDRLDGPSRGSIAVRDDSDASQS